MPNTADALLASRARAIPRSSVTMNDDQARVRAMVLSMLWQECVTTDANVNRLQNTPRVKCVVMGLIIEPTWTGSKAQRENEGAGIQAAHPVGRTITPLKKRRLPHDKTARHGLFPLRPATARPCQCRQSFVEAFLPRREPTDGQYNELPRAVKRFSSEQSAHAWRSPQAHGKPSSKPAAR